MPEAPAWGGFVALLDEADRAAFLRTGRPRRYRAGQALLLAGDHSDHVLCLLLGGAKISVDTPDGHELLLGIRGQGDLIGELAAIDAVGSTRSANVVALSALDTLVITGDEFRRFLRGHPGAAEALAVTLVRRLRQADRKRIEFGSLDTPRRVAHVLVDLAESHGRDDARRRPHRPAALPGGGGRADLGLTGVRGTGPGRPPRPRTDHHCPAGHHRARRRGAPELRQGLLAVRLLAASAPLVGRRGP